VVVRGCRCVSERPRRLRGDANMVRVKGRVTFEGQPLTTGEVSFSSVDGGRVAMSIIDSHGNYELRTSTTVAGVAPGSYK